MKRLVAVTVASMFLSLMTGLVPSAAVSGSVEHEAERRADNRAYYGDTSRAVARHISCKRFYRPRGAGEGAYNLDSGVCWLKGRRVNVITFRGRVQQREWNAAAKLGLPRSHWWANGAGAVVTARNGNKAAARAGARALPGRLVHAL